MPLESVVPEVPSYFIYQTVNISWYYATFVANRLDNIHDYTTT